MKAHLISIGTELTTGQVVDTNAAWLAARLTERGVEVAGKTTLPDELHPLVENVKRIAAECDLVILSGGLGPTDDDLTRSALAEALGVALVTDAASLENLRRFFRVRNREMAPSNAVQAMRPEGSRPIENPCGTAPGIHVRVGSAEVFALPGVPREMRRMFEADVAPRIAASGGGRSVVSMSLHTFGCTESELGERVKDLMKRGRNPTVGTTATEGVISLRLHAAGESPEAAGALLDRDVAELEKRLGRRIFGRDGETMEAVVARLLIEQAATVATAESCTGGLVAKRLTDVPGSSAYLVQGVVSYANEAKTRLLGVPAALIETHGAVSREVAEAMAVGARTRAGTDYALSLTGIAGPSGGTKEKPVGLVYLGLAYEGGVKVSEIRCGRHQPRDEIRARAATAALNLLRLKLLVRS
jgi:nicotinamide-nucleotide amidase